MRLTLDWDTEEIKEMHLPAIRKRSPARGDQAALTDFIGDVDATGKWELWRSAGHNFGDESGYHYIEYDLDGDFETMRKMRNIYGDDMLRIVLDGKRMQWGSPFPAVMYHLKRIRPGEHKPYRTTRRAELVERHWPTTEEEEIKNEDGTLNYAKMTELLADHADFTNRAALFRRIQQRGSVDVATEPRKRGYDIAKGRREPTRGEAKALRDYAEARGIGHYGVAGVPPELAAKPTRSTFHEYWEMPEIEFDQQDFGEGDDSDSEWYPVNMRTGTYSEEVDEMTLKQVHDRISSRLVDELSPGFTQEMTDDEGNVTTAYRGLDLSRWKKAISLERERPLDRDEKARYRQIFWQNQPGTPESRVHDLIERKEIGDPYGDHSICWEIIVYEGEGAFKEAGGTNYWWLARGVLDASDPDAIQAPIKNSAIVADTEGWL